MAGKLAGPEGPGGPPPPPPPEGPLPPGDPPPEGILLGIMGGPDGTPESGIGNGLPDEAQDEW